MRIYTIESLEANQRLDKYLRKLLKKVGNGYIYKMMRKRSITLNGKKAAGNEILKVGDEVKLYMKDETIDDLMGLLPKDSPAMAEYKEAFEELKKIIKVVYEDDNVVIINKPFGVLSQKAEPNDISCNEWLIGYMLDKNSITPEQLHTFKPSVCNRLDKNTSGLLICGKTLCGSQVMSEIIKDRKVRKFYRTFVKGVFDSKLYVNGYLKKDNFANKVTISKKEVPDSDRIETKFIPIECGKYYSYIEVELITGKTHQIRAHAASIGHPILGDYKYGDKNFNEITRRKHQLLHAYRLEFPKMEGEFENLSKKVLIAEEPIYFGTALKRMRN